MLLKIGRGISWATKDVQQANYFGSLTQASTIQVGSFNGQEIYASFKSILPMVTFICFEMTLSGVGCHFYILCFNFDLTHCLKKQKNECCDMKDAKLKLEVNIKEKKLFNFRS